MKLDPCYDCRLGKAAGSYNAAKGWGNPNARLVVLLDCPGDVLAERLLVWIFKRLSLDVNDAWVDYAFKCPIVKGLKKAELKPCFGVCWTSHPRPEVMREDTVLVVAGSWGADFLVNAKMKQWHGRYHTDTEVWITYSLKYLLMNPAECVDLWRVLYKAAEEAGLKPKMKVDVEPFRFPSKKMVA